MRKENQKEILPNVFLMSLPPFLQASTSANLRKCKRRKGSLTRQRRAPRLHITYKQITIITLTLTRVGWLFWKYPSYSCTFYPRHQDWISLHWILLSFLNNLYLIEPIAHYLQNKISIIKLQLPFDNQIADASCCGDYAIGGFIGF